MREEKNRKRDFQNVQRMRNQLIPEEFPEGPYGSAINMDAQPESKSTPWLPGQYRDSAYVYPDKEQHHEVPRKFDQAHQTHE